MPIVEISIPHFYRDRLLTSKWIREKDKYRCYICLRARKKFRLVKMDRTHADEIDQSLRSFGFTHWESELKISAGVNTSCGYFIYVPRIEFEELDFPPREVEDQELFSPF